jgi:hypothetical protein
MEVVVLRDFKKGFAKVRVKNRLRDLHKNFQENGLDVDHKPMYRTLLVQKNSYIWAGKNLTNMERKIREDYRVSDVRDVHVLVFLCCRNVIQYRKEIAWIWRSLWESQSLPWLTRFVILTLHHEGIHAGLLNLLAWSWIFQTVTSLEEFLQYKISKVVQKVDPTIALQEEEEWIPSLEVQVQHALNYFFEFDLYSMAWPAIMFYSRKELTGKGSVQLKKRKRQPLKTITHDSNKEKLLVKMITCQFFPHWIFEMPKKKQILPLVKEFVDKALVSRVSSKKAWREVYASLLTEKDQEKKKKSPET